jgi:hypothetical protein
MFVLAFAVAVAGSACDGNPSRPSKPEPMPTEQGHRLTGLVTEPVGLPLLNAKVTVGAGTPEERSASTATNGRYILIGLTGPQTVVVSADGYVAVTRQVSMDLDVVLDAEMHPVVPASNISGEWRLTFEASASCSGLPAALRARTYRATVAQEGARMTLDLSGAAFQGSTHFEGLVRGTQVTVPIGDWDRAGVGERIGDSQILSLWGTLTATTDASSIKGVFDGDVYVSDTSGGSTQWASCESSTHRVTFRR